MSTMSQDDSVGLVTKLSAFLGTSEPALQLLLTVLAGYPLAIIHRCFFYGKAPTIQHLFCISSGFLLGYWNYGVDMLNAVLAIGVTYVILLVMGGTALAVGLVFTLNLVYLLLGYSYMGTDTYDINWTMPQCILVLRLIAVAFDYYDGQQDFESLGAENKKAALKERPTVLEMYGHSLFPSSFLVGPQFPIRRYQDFINGKFSDPGQLPTCLKAGITRFGVGVAYLTVFQLLGLLVSDDYMYSPELASSSFPKKMLMMGVWGRYTLYKYISCWLLTEGACILFGLSYNGKDEQGAALWNGVANVKLSTFENTTEFNHYIQSFNINTNHWAGQYVYKRLKFMGNRQISQLAALAFLAVWHGLHSGYYVCFGFEFVVMYMERDVKAIVNANERLSKFFSDPRVSVATRGLLRVYTFVLMGWCLLPFALLKWNKYWAAFAAVNHVGSIVFLLWPVVYSPLLKLVFSRNRKKSVE